MAVIVIVSLISFMTMMTLMTIMALMNIMNMTASTSMSSTISHLLVINTVMDMFIMAAIYKTAIMATLIVMDIRV